MLQGVPQAANTSVAASREQAVVDSAGDEQQAEAKAAAKKAKKQRQKANRQQAQAEAQQAQAEPT